MISEERLRELWNEAYPKDLSAFTQAQNYARAVEAEARREALEEAALICDLCGTSAIPANASADNCAAAIRALAEKEG